MKQLQMKQLLAPLLCFLCFAVFLALAPSAGAANYYNVQRSTDKHSDDTISDHSKKQAQETDKIREDEAALEKPPEDSDYKKQNVQVTSVLKCFDKLDPKEKEEIRQHYSKPYQECARRLKLKTHQTQQITPPVKTETSAKKDATAKETPPKDSSAKEVPPKEPPKNNQEAR
jgi:hypothetical protein